MVQQTFQEVSDEVKKELLLLTKKCNIQKHFFGLKTKEPIRFERLFYDENGHTPFSEDLESILSTLSLAGFRHCNAIT